jgi:arylsulfatase A-like enzyme
VPFPHPLHTYNRFTGRFDAKTGPVEGYANSLALSDRILSELREEMERNGTWEDAVVVLSADHPNIFAPGYSAKSDQRVPFLLKLPGKQQPAVFPHRFNTIVTAELLLNVLDGRITNVEEAKAWLGQHRNNAEEPVPANP